MTSRINILLFVLIGILNSCMQTNKTTQSSYNKIISKFEQWRQEQHEIGTYEKEVNCNYEYVSKEGYKGTGIGMPRDIQLYYSNINSDTIMDALICFNPYLCDGGNALMNSQEKILILSKGQEYTVDERTLREIEGKLNSGWLYIHSVVGGTFIGEFQAYAKDDGRCCPSIQKRFNISYTDKSIKYFEN